MIAGTMRAAASFSFYIALVIALLLLLLTLTLHFEGLTLLSHLARKLKLPSHRLGFVLILIGVVLLHVAEIWLFAGCYGLLSFWPYLGDIQPVQGAKLGDPLFHYLYFSAVSYTSLGYGDLVPSGPLRIIASSEALIGLLMIAWSASFTYLLMEKSWSLKE